MSVLFKILEKIYIFFLKKKLLKEYYNNEAEEIMQDFLKENPGYVGIYDNQNKLKEIRKLKVFNKK